MLIIIKIIVSITAVTGIVFVAERNPKIGGLLTGLPLGAGIVMFFYALEQGTAFTLRGIPYGIAGLSSTLAFCVGFSLGGKAFRHNRRLHGASSLCCGLAFFFLAGWLVSRVHLNLLSGIAIFCGGMIFSLAFFTRTTRKAIIQHHVFTFPLLVFRAIFVAAAILIITGIAGKLGPEWAGIMASFPSTLCPVLLILAWNYHDELYPTFLKHFSYGITNLVVYYLLILFLYPRFDIASGTVIAYLACFIYLYLLNFITKATAEWLRKRPRRHSSKQN